MTWSVLHSDRCENKHSRMLRGGLYVTLTKGLPHVIKTVGVFQGEIRGPPFGILQKLDIDFGNVIPFVNKLRPSSRAH